MNFLEMYNLLEGAAYDTALKICGGNKELLDLFKDPSPTQKYLPMMVTFYTQQYKAIQNRGAWKIPLPVDRDEKGHMVQYVERGSLVYQINNIFASYHALGNKMKPLEYKSGQVFYANEPIDFMRFSEAVHAKEGESKYFADRRNDTESFQGDEPLFNKNGIRIYEAHGPHKCIHYGKGYSFCISQPRNTMWQSYRDSQESTFYFVYDDNKKAEDPLHIVVVDSSNSGIQLTDARNSTGTIAEFGTNVQAYMNYLKSKGVDTEMFKNEPMTDDERDESEALSGQNDDLNWFKRIGYDYQSKYIGRGHPLTDEQFDYIIKHNLTKLVEQYIATGSQVSHRQLEAIAKNPQWLRTYLRARFIIQDQLEDISKDELVLSCRFKDLQLKNSTAEAIWRTVKYRMMNQWRPRHAPEDRKMIFKCLLEKMETVNKWKVCNLLDELKPQTDEMDQAIDAVVESERIEPKELLRVFLDAANANQLSVKNIRHHLLTILRKVPELDEYIFTSPPHQYKGWSIKDFCEQFIEKLLNPDPAIIEILKKKPKFWDEWSDGFDPDIDDRKFYEIDTLLRFAANPESVAQYIDLGKMLFYYNGSVGHESRKEQYIAMLVKKYSDQNDNIKNMLGGDPDMPPFTDEDSP